MDYQYQTTEQPSSPRKAWPIVLAVVVALIVACGAGVCVYRNKHQEALATCRQSLAEFSSARKAVLDTSENGSELQQGRFLLQLLRFARRKPPSRSSIS